VSTNKFIGSYAILIKESTTYVEGIIAKILQKKEIYYLKKIFYFNKNKIYYKIAEWNKYILKYT
jgi:hypothetical protein